MTNENTKCPVGNHKKIQSCPFIWSAYENVIHYYIWERRNTTQSRNDKQFKNGKIRKVYVFSINL